MEPDTRRAAAASARLACREVWRRACYGLAHVVALSPCGRRGERPVLFTLTRPIHPFLFRGILDVPGVSWDARRGAFCTSWDAAWAVARLLGVPEPEPPPLLEAHVPGLAQYRALGLQDVLKDFVKEDLLFLARVPGGVLGEPPRAGKTLGGIALAELLDARKVLVIGPSIARWVWAEELAKWTRRSSLLLDGRGGRHALEFCTTCNGRGELVTTSDGGARPCLDCCAKNGQALGHRIFDVPATCRTHGHPRPDHSEDAKYRCAACLQELRDALSRHRFVLANFDIMVPHRADVGGGQMVERIDLPGWVNELERYPFDLALIDEAHLGLGGVENTARRRAIKKLLDPRRSPDLRVYILTGTLFDGFVRNAYGPLDIATGGLFGSPRQYLQRFCDLHRGEYGLVKDGRSINADTELLERLKLLKIEHSDEVIFKDTPPIQRQIIRLDPPRDLFFEVSEEDLQADLLRQRRVIHQAVRQVSLLKLPAVVGNVVEELVVGRKVVVFCRYKATARAAHAAFIKAITKGSRSAVLKQQLAMAFLATGAQGKRHSDGDDGSDNDDDANMGAGADTVDNGESTTGAGTGASASVVAESVKARFDLAERFRSYPGAAVITCTYHSMQVALSLLGASSVHEIEWCEPGKAVQAEKRPFGQGVHLRIVHYSMRRTIDEHLELTILPQVETIWRMNKDASAGGLVGVLQHPEDRTFEKVWDRLTRHLREKTAQADHLDASETGAG